MEPEKKDSKPIKESVNTLLSKAQSFLERFVSQVNSFWGYIRRHVTGAWGYIRRHITGAIIISIIAIFIAIGIAYRHSIQTERFANDNVTRHEKASKERQTGFDNVTKSIKEMSKNFESRQPDMKEVMKEVFKEVLSEEKRQQKTQDLNRQNMMAITKVTPPLKIFSEEPYGEFACFDYVVFHVVNETKNEIIFSNEQSDPVVSYSFTYNKQSGKVSEKPEAIRFNAESPKASYKNYLGYLLFIKAQFSNARLVFWNLIEDTPFIRTGPTIPVNMRYDYEGTKAVITFIDKMTRIEHFVGRKIPLKLPPTESVYEDVNYVYEALSGNPMQAGFKFEWPLKSRKEKELFLKQFFQTNLNGVKYRLESKSNVVDIYGVPVELGMWTMDFPDSTITPTLEELKNDRSDDPVTITIETKTRDNQIVLIFNSLRKEYRLTDPPPPLFRKHPLISR